MLETMEVKITDLNWEYETKLRIIKTLITEVGVTRTAKLSGLSRQTIYNILKDVHELSLRNYLILKQVLLKEESN